ncbi:MAG: hypothetical protein RR343_06680, partial [Oscillospiraceae bacterium]
RAFALLLFVLCGFSESLCKTGFSCNTTDNKMITFIYTIANNQKNADTCIINGRKKCYFLDFGWADYMGKNTCTTEYGMFGNGNKAGIMD